MQKDIFDYGNSEFSNVERYAALRSVTIGMCAFSQKCLDAIISYQNLLIDELEAMGKPSPFSEKSRKLAELLRQHVLELAGIFRPSSLFGEKLDLSAFCEGMTNQFSKSNGDDKQVSSNVTEVSLIRGDAFQLQQTFFEIWENLRLIDSAKSWEVSIEKASFDQFNKSSFELTGKENDFYVLSFLQASEPPGLKPAFVPLLNIIQSDSASELYTLRQVLHWAGIFLSHGGNLLFNPLRPEAGLLFLFPVLQEEQSESLDILQYDPANNDKTILIVDDEDMIWDVISAMLQDLGYRVIFAENGREAVEIYQNNPGQIDLVLLDMIMPKMSGSEAFFMLKKIDPQVKVLLSSGYVSEDEVQEVLNAGAAGFLRKPYHMNELALKVKEILSS